MALYASRYVYSLLSSSQEANITYLWNYNGKVRPSEKAQQVVEWLNLRASARPRFISLYFQDVDVAGHAFGPDSEQVKAAIARVDDAINVLISGIRDAGLEQRADIVVVSDHGMTKTTQTQSLNWRDYLNDDEAWVIDHRPLLQIYPFKVNG